MLAPAPATPEPRRDQPFVRAQRQAACIAHSAVRPPRTPRPPAAARFPISSRPPGTGRGPVAVPAVAASLGLGLLQTPPCHGQRPAAAAAALGGEGRPCQGQSARPVRSGRPPSQPALQVKPGAERGHAWPVVAAARRRATPVGLYQTGLAGRESDASLIAAVTALALDIRHDSQADRADSNHSAGGAPVSEIDILIWPLARSSSPLSVRGRLWHLARGPPNVGPLVGLSSPRSAHLSSRAHDGR